MHSELLMIAGAAVVLLSYWYMHLAQRHRLPAVMLLLLTGLGARWATHFAQSTVVVPPALIAVLGSAGLVLIVLEGALDLQLQPGRRVFLLRTFGAALLGLAFTTGALAGLLVLVQGLHPTLALLAAAPFGVISSAVAIPSAQALDREGREFVVYESSWSDILGVMLFNALLVAAAGGAAVLHLVGGGLAVLVIGAALSLGMYWLVGHLEGHVKFIPLLSALILLYAGADALHLSPLLMVLVVGLTLNNGHLLRRVRLLQRLHSAAFERELERLKHLTAELTFLVRTFFFLLLGYVTDVTTLLEPRAWLVALAIVAVVFAVRWPALRLAAGRHAHDTFWMAPRGLITVTLFFSLPPSVSGLVPPATLVLVVILTGVAMSVGLRRQRRAEGA
ncbi:MAG TPA: cation:proton antiporter, partial [Burkholderiaceae bacterium]